MPRAVVVHAEGPYQNCKIEQVAPLEARPGCAIVKVLSCGLAFPDVLTILGKHIGRRQPPFVPGSEVCGEVTSVGEGVTDLVIGDRVFGSAPSGALGEEAEVVAAGVYKMPEGVDPNVAAGFELNYGTTYHGLVDIAKLQKGETLLVLGASGGVGAAAIDIGKAVGATVIACASSTAKLQFCKEAGADVLINYETASLRDELKRLKLDGKVDVVYDPVGGKWSEPAIRSLAWGGRFLVVGFASGGEVPKDAIPKVPLNLALLGERQIQGVFWGAWKARDGNEANSKNINQMMSWILEGRLNPVISKVYPLDDTFQNAFDDMMSRRVMGKICIQPGLATAKL